MARTEYQRFLKEYTQKIKERYPDVNKKKLITAAAYSWSIRRDNPHLNEDEFLEGGYQKYLMEEKKKMGTVEQIDALSIPEPVQQPTEDVSCQPLVHEPVELTQMLSSLRVTYERTQQTAVVNHGEDMELIQTMTSMRITCEMVQQRKTNIVSQKEHPWSTPPHLIYDKVPEKTAVNYGEDMELLQRMTSMGITCDMVPQKKTDIVNQKENPWSTPLRLTYDKAPEETALAIAEDDQLSQLMTSLHIDDTPFQLTKMMGSLRM